MNAVGTLAVLWAQVLVLAPFVRVAAEPERAQALPTCEMVMEVFVRSDSAHSRKAMEFAKTFPQTHPGVRTQIHDVVNNDAARRQF